MAGSQIRTVPSPPAVASQVPSGAIATAVTRPVWPVRAARCWPVAGSQIRTVPSLAGGGQPGAVRGDRHRRHRAGVAGEGGALLRRWPGPRSAPSRRRRRLASQVPSGAIATAVTAPVWPVRAARCWPVAGSQIRTVPSPPAVASQVPSGAIATAVTCAGVAGEGGALLAGGRVPDPHRPVVAAGGQPGAVRGDRHRRHRAGVAGEGGALLAGGRVPDPHRPVVAAGGQPGAVRGDRHRRSPRRCGR